MIDPSTHRLDCGKTLDEVSEYLEAGRTPYDPDIETCPECLNALDALSSAGRLSRELLDADARTLPEPDAGWFDSVMTAVRSEMRAGRSIPLSHPDPRVQASITEGAVHALIRSTADRIRGVYVGRSEIIGDVEQPGAPVAIGLTASVAWGVDIRAAADDVRAAVAVALATHTELDVRAIDVDIHDVHRPTPPEERP